MAEFVSNPEIVKEENLVYKRTSLLTPKALSYCPGCGHGTAHRVIMEVLEEMDIQSETIGVAPVGCSVLAYDFMDIDIQQAAHGRAPAVATAIKRLFPEKYVFTYQGDGDLAAIGTGETIHACNRGENFTILFTVKTARRERPVTGLDLNEDLHVSVLKGRVTITGLEELGGGLYLIKAEVDSQAAPGPLKIDIVLLKGGPSVRVSTSDFFDKEPSTTPLVQVIPSVVGTGNTAIIIATPQDFHGNPVSGLELEAAVIHGSGEILEQMAESPAGSGVYIGKFQADTIPDETTIAVRITNTATRPETQVNIQVR